MLTEQEGNQRVEPKPRDGRSREAAIRDNLMQGLGRPAELHQVQVRPLWNNNYRVNVFVGADAASATVSDSFFLEADGEGNILASAPAITRRY